MATANSYVNGSPVGGSSGGGGSGDMLASNNLSELTDLPTARANLGVGSLKYARTTKSADYTVASTDYLIEVDTTSTKPTITVPAASSNTGRALVVVNKAGSRRFKVTAVSGLVAGLTTFESLYLGQELHIVSDGTNWNSVGQGSGLVIDPAARADVTVKTRFRGNSGVTLVSNAVSSWAPLGPATGYTAAAAQSTAGSRPTVTTGWSGDEDALLFDGTDDYLATAAWSGGAIAQPTTIFLVGDTNSASQKIVFDGIASGNRQNSDYATTTLSAYAGTSLTATLSTAQTFVNNKRVLSYVFNNASSALFHNGQRMSTGTAGTGTLTGLTLGARYSADGFFWSGNIAEVIVCSGALSDWVVSRISKFLMDYWQITSVY